MKKMQAGFTLIELMIVVAIIGILAAIAIPAYQDYIVRAKVTELMTAASACKASVSEFIQTNNALPTDIDAAGCASNQTQYVASMTVTAGVINVVARTGTGFLPATAAGSIILTPTQNAGGTVSWSCTASTIPDKFLPANCR